MGETNGSEDRKRRRLRPVEVDMAKRFVALGEPGTIIRFDQLPDAEMRKALFPSSHLRLVEKGILVTEHDEENGRLVSVSVDPMMLKAYEWDMTAPEPKQAQSRDDGEPRLRKPRSKVSDPKYKLHKLVAENPRRPDTHGWYNWEYCYRDGMSIPEYLSNLNYPRDIIIGGRVYFNGPMASLLYSDFDNKSIGIYDSTLDPSDENYWLRDLSRETEEEAVIEDENAADPVPTSHTGQTEAQEVRQNV